MTGNTWNEEEKKNIRQALAVMIEIQKGYGKKFDLKTILMGWKMILEEDYTGKQILWACKQYMKEKDDIPSPANLIKIINQKKTKNSDYDLWDRRVGDFVKKGFWIDTWGNNPTKENKFIPKGLLEKHSVPLQIEDNSNMVKISDYVTQTVDNLTIATKKD